ncbi:hypothetical protein F4679DRAFT_598698 [Xylaria curta]|nr:hypothetical protein F4679DRAFT_598698 [Xylaria curta]
MEYDFCNSFYFNKNHLYRMVKKINIYAYPNRNSPEDPATNHWVMFLQYSAISSVKVDMYPSKFSGKGILELSSKKYTQSDRAIYSFSIETINGLTVETLADTINKSGLDKYYFTKELEGCRYWIYCIIHKLEEDSYLPAGSTKNAWDSLSYYYGDQGEPVPREIKYYSED